MQADIQEIYTKTILPLPDKEKLQIATLILEAVTGKTASANGKAENGFAEPNGDENTTHPLELLGRIPKIDAPPDFSERHDFYAHGKKAYLTG
ncbi:MAG: hypothetical protein LH614_06020 [Pyrinomonadaceae bacterium]|nr:hypothetical protein [Pyrinomonadaceae bacterium]